MRIRLHQKGANHGYLDNRCSTGGGMANIFRLILSILVLYSGASFALSPQDGWTGDKDGTVYSSPQQACTSGCRATINNPGYTFSSSSEISYMPGSFQCYYKTLSGSIVGACLVTKAVSKCPANSVKSGGSCICSEGYEEKDGQCRPKNPCPAGQHEEGGACVPDQCGKDEIRVGGQCVPEKCPDGSDKVNGKCPSECERKKGNTVAFEATSASSDSAVCYFSCMATYTMKACHDDQNCTSYYTYTGSSCTPGSGGSNPGGGNGGQNPTGPGGTTDPGPGGTTDPGSGSDPGSGGTTGGGTTGGGTGTGSGGTGDGGTSSCPANMEKVGTSCVLSCPADHVRNGAGECVSNGPTNPGGGDGQNPTDPGGGGGDNPTDPGGGGTTGGGTTGGGTTGGGTTGGGGSGDGDGDCEGEDCKKGFSGSCESDFSCKGDAVQCAIAKEQHKRNCKLFDTESDESKLYEKDKDKKGDQTKDLDDNKEENIASKIQTSSAIGGGSCIANKQFTVMGTTFTIPFNEVCPYLRAAGDALVAVAFLVALRILTRT